jgi:uncharacterized membrane protein YeaQ/YmgE (transglycosylase-associated protein family)
MLILAIILGIIGAAFAYFGRRHAVAAAFWFGVLILAIAAVLLLIWLVAVLNDNGVHNAIVLLT